MYLKIMNCSIISDTVGREEGRAHAQQTGFRRDRCRECGGSSICTHGRVKSQCKECGGSAICTHGRRKSRCKECRGQPAAAVVMGTLAPYGATAGQCIVVPTGAAAGAGAGAGVGISAAAGGYVALQQAGV